MVNETKQHTLTEKQFCEIYTQFRGVEIDKVAQIKHCSFTGEELFEFLSFAAKANELRIKDLEAAMKLFIDRVEKGEVRSTQTYNQFKELLSPLPASIKERGELKNCAAGMDGDCNHENCPQNRDGEPNKTGRFCPLPHYTDNEDF